ncbi:MAG: hypothetical protein LBJ63_03115 [Prevotellaceae bacterium]|jgi:hypothetical protein|nr:hypothetical protein [Prevotellaceae bacterium]
MKNKAILFIILLVTIFQCSSNNKQDDKCKINNEKSARCDMEYQLDKDISHLDSALYYINEVFDECIECKKYAFLLGMRKVVIYSMKNEYLNSINFLDTLLEKEIISQFYKDVLTNRFNAMNAQYYGDSLLMNIYVKNAFSEIEQFFLSHKSSIDSFLNMPYITAYEQSELHYGVSKLQKQYIIIPVQYYYYKAQIEGIEKVRNEVDSLQNAINGDEKYFEIIRIMLEEDFMRFMGI